MIFLLRAALLMAMATATPALAHDMWVEPESYSVVAGQTSAISLRVGHADDEDAWRAPWERVHSFRSYGPTGVSDQQAALTVPPVDGMPNAVITLKESGTHMVVLESYHSVSNLEAAKFTGYAKTEGLDNVIALRAQTGKSDAPGVEFYSRRAKALVQVGPTATDNVLQPIGQTLEIVPLRNPYSRGGGTALPVRVLFHGRPLAGVQIRLLPLSSKIVEPQKRRTDADGRAQFDVPRRGRWLIMAVYARPVTGNPAADFDTVFASLTFGYGPRADC